MNNRFQAWETQHQNPFSFPAHPRLEGSVLWIYKLKNWPPFGRIRISDWFRNSNWQADSMRGSPITQRWDLKEIWSPATEFRKHAVKRYSEWPARHYPYTVQGQLASTQSWLYRSAWLHENGSSRYVTCNLAELSEGGGSMLATQVVLQPNSEFM